MLYPESKAMKIKNRVPQQLSDHDTKVLDKVQRRAHQLDTGLLNLCGIRLGWSSVIAIIPVVGDVLDTCMALMVLRTSREVQGGLPKGVQAKMIFNIITDFGIGLVPLIGDIADVLFRANTRNAVVLKDYLYKKAKEEARSGVSGSLEPFNV
ncbi:hypothetical protein BJ875DRAFT_412715 [Amylocarpus encephaloides]|uniref:DUF4112 domain-containing protein n=1 Tax=Amylocarpus encephaloides TaxID=45428 RepID=A0A9P7Y773_9HELO|nr:hypothetical protein BJ875DRAFT_412715 [Amylocarpus encephaloides]